MLQRVSARARLICKQTPYLLKPVQSKHVSNIGQVYSHDVLDDAHPRVPIDDCAALVAHHASRGAVGHDLPRYDAANEDLRGRKKIFKTSTKLVTGHYCSTLMQCSIK
jgi:hypothetical protein